MQATCYTNIASLRARIVCLPPSVPILTGKGLPFGQINFRKDSWVVRLGITPSIKFMSLFEFLFVHSIGVSLRHRADWFMEALRSSCSYDTALQHTRSPGPDLTGFPLARCEVNNPRHSAALYDNHNPTAIYCCPTGCALSLSPVPLSLLLTSLCLNIILTSSSNSALICTARLSCPSPRAGIR